LGHIVELGPTAYIDQDEAWVQEGDRVFFSRYVGDIMTGEDGCDYRLINDNDVLAHASSTLEVGDLDFKRESFDANP
jgi:co-chaperonin GroES (HSP10)